MHCRSSSSKDWSGNNNKKNIFFCKAKSFNFFKIAYRKNVK